MKIKVKAVAAIANIPDKNGSVLTTNDLLKLASTSVGNNITLNFDPTVPPIGKVIGAEVKKDRLIITAIIDEQNLGRHIVPSYSILINSRSVEKALAYAITDKPAQDMEGSTLL